MPRHHHWCRFRHLEDSRVRQVQYRQHWLVCLKRLLPTPRDLERHSEAEERILDPMRHLHLNQVWPKNLMI